MDQKQVIIVSLLVIAIILSAASVMMNVSVLSNVQIRESSAPQAPSVSLEVLESPDNGGQPNGLG